MEIAFYSTEQSLGKLHSVKAYIIYKRHTDLQRPLGHRVPRGAYHHSVLRHGDGMAKVGIALFAGILKLCRLFGRPSWTLRQCFLLIFE